MINNKHLANTDDQLATTTIQPPTRDQHPSNEITHEGAINNEQLASTVPTTNRQRQTINNQREINILAMRSQAKTSDQQRASSKH